MKSNPPLKTPLVRLRLPHVAQVHLEELVHLQRGRVSEMCIQGYSSGQTLGWADLDLVVPLSGILDKLTEQIFATLWNIASQVKPTQVSEGRLTVTQKAAH